MGGQNGFCLLGLRGELGKAGEVDAAALGGDAVEAELERGGIAGEREFDGLGQKLRGAAFEDVARGLRGFVR